MEASLIVKHLTICSLGHPKARNHDGWLCRSYCKVRVSNITGLLNRLGEMEGLCFVKTIVAGAYLLSLTGARIPPDLPVHYCAFRRGIRRRPLWRAGLLTLAATAHASKMLRCDAASRSSTLRDFSLLS